MHPLRVFPVAFLFLAACSDALPSGIATAPTPAPATYRAQLRCTADVAQPRLTCDGGEAGGTGPARSLIVGGQHVYVRLSSSGAGYNPADSIFQVDVSVENLMTQVLGSPDGETDTGVRVFFETEPTPVSGSGSVAVENADGHDLFLAAPAPYYAYGGLLYTGWASETKTWRFRMDPEVGRFVFTVYVQGQLPHENSLLLFRPQYPGDGGFVTALWGSSANDVFAAGFFGALLRYTGNTWTEDASPTSENLWDMWGSSATDVFAVGDAGTIVHWDGTDWETMDSGLVNAGCGCGTASVWGLWGSGPNDVHAVADGGIILHYDGTAWTAQDTLPVAGLYGIWGSGPADVFAVGDDGGIFHYDGTSWTAMTSGLEGTGEYINAVWGTSSTDVYAAASTGLLRYDGTSWSPMDGAETCEHLSIWGSASDDIFVINQCGLGHWDGSTWTYMDPGGFATELWGTGPHHVLTNTNGGIARGSR